MRGKQKIIFIVKHNIRITPADAGKTTHTPPLKAPQWDHPRGCGENQTQNPFAFPPQGSPPQVRGKQFLALLHAAFKQDPPRRCGENTIGHEGDQGIKGSPPQVRGKPARIEAAEPLSRITPAGAGKTLKID